MAFISPFSWEVHHPSWLSSSNQKKACCAAPRSILSLETCRRRCRKWLSELCFGGLGTSSKDKPWNHTKTCQNRSRPCLYGTIILTRMVAHFNRLKPVAAACAPITGKETTETARSMLRRSSQCSTWTRNVTWIQRVTGRDLVLASTKVAISDRYRWC